MRKNNRKQKKAFFKVAAYFAAVIAGGWFIYAGIAYFLNNSSYFRIKKVVFVGIDNKDIADKIAREYIGEYMFSCDIKEAGENIRIRYPQFYDVNVVRDFPDRLTIYIVQRQPVVQINSREKGFFLLDQEGMIVSGASNIPRSGFVLLEGVKGAHSLSFGKKLFAEDLRRGLQLVLTLQDNRSALEKISNNFTLDENVTVDISKLPTMIVKLKSLELRFAEDSYKDKIKMLFSILPNVAERLEQIQYIDFRFDEPVVSFKR